MTTKPRTLRELAEEALAVQDACNLCGVAQSFARVMIALGEHTRGTDERNQHPIAVLWADKIAHLTGTQTLLGDRVTAAYKWCRELLAPATRACPCCGHQADLLLFMGVQPDGYICEKCKLWIGPDGRPLATVIG